MAGAVQGISCGMIQPTPAYKTQYDEMLPNLNGYGEAAQNSVPKSDLTMYETIADPVCE